MAVKDKGDLANGEFVFTGWNTKSDGTGTFYAEGANYIANETATLYAMWGAIFKVTYDANVPEGSVKTGAVPAEQIKVTGVDLELNFENTLAITGFALVGWKDAAGTNYPQNSYYRKDANVTLKAQWKKSYTVKYNANGGTGVVPDAQIKVQGEVLYLDFSNNLVNANNAFTGWNTEKDGTGENYGWIEEGRWKADYRADSNITLYANWIQSYTVTYHANEAITGTVPASQVKTKGVPLTLVGNTGNLGREGFVFDGWNTEPDGTGTTYELSSDYWYDKILSTYTADANVTLYVKWKQAYTVTFDPNGGTGSVPNSLIKKHGESIRLEDCENLTKTGYVFGGWNESRDGSGKNYGWNGQGYDSWYTSYSDDANIILYAEWKPTYTVTYDGNGATKGTVPALQEKIEGVQLTLAGNSGNLIKDDGIFGGWNTQADGKGTDYVANSSYNADAKVTLYVKWVPFYTITYNGNGATKGTVPEPQRKGQGINIQLDFSGNLVKGDSAFGGWNTKADKSGDHYGSFNGEWRTVEYKNDESVTLYAEWIPTYLVTYDANADDFKGNAPEPQRKIQGITLGLNKNHSLTRDGYMLAGWSTERGVDGNGALYTDGNYESDKDLTLYAQWKLYYTVTYDLNGETFGTTPVPVTKLKGENVQLACPQGWKEDYNFGKDGYIFAGWNTQKDGSGTNYGWAENLENLRYYSEDGWMEYNAPLYSNDADITLYAEWKEVFTVTYYANGKEINSQSKIKGIDFGLANQRDFDLTNGDSIFVGWNTKEDLTGTTYPAGSSYTTDESINLYAKWRGPYTVTYNANAPDAELTGDVPATQEKGADERIELNLECDLERSGYILTGWKDNESGTVYSKDPYYWDRRYEDNADLILYAQWAQVYTVTYNDNVGDEEISVPAAVTKKSGEEFNLDFNVGSREGFTFAGWNTNADGSGTNYGTWDYGWEGTFTIGNSNVNLYAKWIPNSITITYNANGGEGSIFPKEITAEGYLQAVAFENMGIDEYYPSIEDGNWLIEGMYVWSPKEGHSFAGWSTNPDATEADPIYAPDSRYKTYANLTLYAVWQENE